MILNSHLPIKAWLDPQTARLPGVRPIAIEDWLARSDTYQAQMTYRRELIKTQREHVFVATEEALHACKELRDMMGMPPTEEHALLATLKSELLRT